MHLIKTTQLESFLYAGHHNRIHTGCSILFKTWRSILFLFLSFVSILSEKDYNIYSSINPRIYQKTRTDSIKYVHLIVYHIDRLETHCETIGNKKIRLSKKNILRCMSK